MKESSRSGGACAFAMHALRGARSLLTIGALLVSAGAAAGTITCESSGRQEKFCRVNTAGGVSLQTQLSRAGCYQGSTWGYDSRGIWVANGCRAVFNVGTERYRRDDDDDNKAGAILAGAALLALGAAAAHEAHEDHHQDRHGDDYYRYQPDRTQMAYYRDRHERNKYVLCESNKDRYNYCRVPIHNAHVRLAKRHSRSGCRFHEDWGYNNSGIWVENGCRATFEIDY